MITFFRQLLTVAAAAMLVSLGGCQASNPSFSKDTSGEAEFAAGAGRSATAETLVSLAKILAAQGKDDACAEVLGQVTREYPRCLGAYCELAEVNMRHHRADDAVAALDAGLKISPGNPVLLNDLGMCRLLQQQYEPASQLFTQAAAAGGDARSRANLAVALGMLGRYDEALSVYAQIVPAGQAHYNLALLCQARNDHARAHEEFLRAHQIDSKLPPPPA